jgi:hypothetical protein
MTKAHSVGRASEQSVASSESCRVVKVPRERNKREPSLGPQGEGHESKEELGVHLRRTLRRKGNGMLAQSDQELERPYFAVSFEAERESERA